jgi:hypothetical protein
MRQLSEFLPSPLPNLADDVQNLFEYEFEEQKDVEYYRFDFQNREVKSAEKFGLRQLHHKIPSRKIVCLATWQTRGSSL